MKYETTALRLKEALEDKRMSASELSRISGVGKSSISQYCSGSHSPTNINSGKIAKVLKVNPVWLMGFDVPKYESHIKIENIDKKDFEKIHKAYCQNDTSKNNLMSYVDFLLTSDS